MPSTNYLISAAILILLVLGLVFFPEKENQRELSPDQLLQEIQNDKRFISVDQLAEMLINQDPALLLVDVRDPASFSKFALPGALNIPFKKMLNEEFQSYFDNKAAEIVFYSNDHSLAEQAWIIKKREKVDNIRILKGGLNQWTKDIFLAEAPPETASAEAFERYSFLIGARKYFVGVSGELDPALTQVPVEEKQPQKVKVVPKVKKKKEEEGCL